ncbi:MAG: zinc dependent phospholipase C family protein [Solobacterium sp.]|nr:zinc dependent phospholipase C family protein [Solobacterium sp.]
MPAATTHVEFAKDVFVELPKDTQQAIDNFPMYYLGSQGPDIFFFSKGVVLPGTLYSLGQKMHDEKIQEVISYLQDYTKEHPSLYPYYAGYICHYALDRVVHPLVNYYAKVSAMKDSEAHFQYEGDIDVYTLNKKQHGYDVYDRIRLTKQDAKALSQMYHYLFLAVYQLNVKESAIQEAIVHMPVLTKWLRPGKKWKYNLVSRIENRIGKRFVSAMMLDEKDPVNSPVFNKNHEVWMNLDKEDTRSFEDLYQLAIQEASLLLTNFNLDQVNLDFIGKPL